MQAVGRSAPKLVERGGNHSNYYQGGAAGSGRETSYDEGHTRDEWS